LKYRALTLKSVLLSFYIQEHTHIRIHALDLDAMIVVCCFEFNVVMFYIAWSSSKIYLKQCCAESFLFLLFYYVRTLRLWSRRLL